MKFSLNESWIYEKLDDAQIKRLNQGREETI